MGRRKNRAMKLSFTSCLILVSFFASAQRGDPKIYYWTIWFKTTGCVDSAKKIPSSLDTTMDCSHDKWVQSFFDPWQATNYYRALKSSGTVIIWNKYRAKVDTASVYIDSFNMVARKYSWE